MKKERKIVAVNFEQVEFTRDFDSIESRGTFRYEFTTREPFDFKSLECTIEIDVPETLTEFREVNNLSKDDLIQWLNKNYKT